MSGTKAGGRKAAQTYRERYPAEYRRKQSSKGGKLGGGKGGFTTNPELARIAGRLGGKISKRHKGAASV